MVRGWVCPIPCNSGCLSLVSTGLSQTHSDNLALTVAGQGTHMGGCKRQSHDVKMDLE